MNRYTRNESVAVIWSWANDQISDGGHEARRLQQ